MPSIYRFGFENNIIPAGVTLASGGQLQTLQTSEVYNVPAGSIDLLFVIDTMTSSSRSLVESMIANAASFLERFRTMSVLRVGIATVGQYQDQPYINFYGWTLCHPVTYADWTTEGTTLFKDSYWLSSLSYPDGSPDVIKTLHTVLNEIDVMAKSDRVEVQEWWTRQVLIPFLYGRFTDGFGVWSQANSSVPVKSIVPDPVLPLFYSKIGGEASSNPAWTSYTPYARSSAGQLQPGVMWGFRRSSDERPSDFWKRTLSYPRTSDQVGWTYAQTVFISDHSQWAGFSGIDPESLEGKRLKEWSSVHSLVLNIPTQDESWKSSFLDYSGAYNASVRELKTDRFAWSWGVLDNFNRLTLTNQSVWYSGRCRLALNNIPAVAGSFQVRQQSPSQFIQGTWTLLEVGNIRVDASYDCMSVYANGSQVASISYPGLVPQVNLEFSFSYTPSLFRAYLDGCEIVVPSDLAEGFQANLTQILIGGVPFIENIAVNSIDTDDYALRYTGKYDPRPEDFVDSADKPLDVNIPTPVQCVAAGFESKAYVFSKFAAGYQFWDGAPGGYLVHKFNDEVNATLYPDLRVEGINMAYAASRISSANSTAPLELGIQTEAYKRPIVRLTQMSNTSRSFVGSVFYDENADKLLTKRLHDLFSRAEVIDQYTQGLWLNYYSGITEITTDVTTLSSSAEYPIEDLNDVPALISGESGLGHITGYLRIDTIGTFRFNLVHNCPVILKISEQVLLNSTSGVVEDATRLKADYHKFDLFFLNESDPEIRLNFKPDELLVETAVVDNPTDIDYEISAVALYGEDRVQLKREDLGDRRYEFRVNETCTIELRHQVPIKITSDQVVTFSYSGLSYIEVGEGVILVEAESDVKHSILPGSILSDFRRQEFETVPASLYFRPPTSPNSYPELHGWSPIEMIRIGTRLNDISIKEGDAWSFTLPPDTFLGIDQEAGYQIVAQAAQAAVSTDTSWITFNANTLVLSGSPTNDNVGVFKITALVRGVHGGLASQSFFLTVENVNTAPYLVDSIEDQVIEEESTAYLDLSSYFTDDDILHGDVLRYSLYTEQLQEQEALIQPDFYVTFVVDNSGSMRSVASTIKHMVEEGLIANDLKDLFGGEYADRVRVVYGSEYWIESLRNVAPNQSSPGRKQIVVVVGDEDGDYDTNSTKTPESDATLLSELVRSGSLDKYYGLVLSVSGETPSLQDRFDELVEDHAGFRSLTEGDLDYASLNISRNVERDREENYYYLLVKYALADMGLYIERGYQVPPAWMRINGSLVTFSPEFGHIGTYHLIARATDSQGLFTEARFNVESLPAYHSPVLTNPFATVLYVKGLPFNRILPEVFTDVDVPRGDTLTVTISGMPEWLAWNNDLRMLYGSAPLDGLDSYQLVYQVVDLQGNTGEYKFTLEAVPNPRVIGQIGNRTMAYNQSIAILLGAIFDYVQPLTYSIRVWKDNVEVFIPEWLSVSQEHGVLNVTDPGPNNLGQYAIDVRATAENQSYATATFTLTITNQAPVYIGGLNNLTISYAETASINISDAFFDPEGNDTLAFEAQLPPWLQLIGHTVQGTPGIDHIGEYQVTVAARDAVGQSVEHTFIINVANYAPAALPLPDQSIEIGQSLRVSIVGKFDDPERGPLDLDVAYVDRHTNQPVQSWITYDPSRLDFTGTPTIDDLGFIKVVITATDEAGDSVSASFIVEAFNRPHVIAPIQDQVLNYLVPWSLDLTGVFAVTFPELATWEVNLPPWMGWNNSTKTLSATPPTTSVGQSHTVSVTVTETVLGNVRSATDSFQVNVVNRPPVKVADLPDLVVSYNDEPFSVYVGNIFDDPDVDGYAGLTWGVSGASWVTLDQETKTIVGNPTAARVGDYTINVWATDQFGESKSTTFKLKVVNMPPFVNQAIQDQFMRYVDVRTVDVSNLFADPESLATLSVSVVSELPSWINYDPLNKRLTFNPGPTDIGPVTIQLQARDDCGATVQSSFKMTVQNEKPYLVSPLSDKTIIVQAPFNYELSGLFGDPETGGDSQLSYTWSYFKGGMTYSPAWLKFDAVNKRLYGTPTTSDVALFQAYVTVRDPAGGEVWSSFSIEVKDIPNRPPELVVPIPDQEVYVMTGWTYDFNGIFNDPDDAPSTLSYSDLWKDSSGAIVPRPSWVSFNQAARTFTGVAQQEDIGYYDVTLRCTGTFGRYIEDTFRLTVRPPRGFACGGAAIQAPRDAQGRTTTSAGQMVTTEITMGPTPGSVEIIFDGQTWYDTIEFFYAGEPVTIQDYDREIVNGVITYTPVNRTVLRAGRDWDGKTPQDVSSKLWTWNYPATPGHAKLTAIVTNGAGSVSWSLRVKCPV